ncbi:MAG TPA: Asp23/Gls24 family envelope stress response protein [Anaerolineae bacterium]|jgi:uncharacterized alkaline shock family protein YloU|nr:Asp23/Gls24 family envelope stress response protein [Anaerolineae bacterium]
MGDHMDETTEEHRGAITIDPSVLLTIARLSALGVVGVCRMADRTPRGILGIGGSGEGVRVQVTDDAVSVDLYLIMESGSNMVQVGRSVQSEVERAIREMVGMAVHEVNVHIEDVQFPCPEFPVQER